MSGFMDALEHFFSSKEAEPTKPRVVDPMATVQADPAGKYPQTPLEAAVTERFKNEPMSRGGPQGYFDSGLTPPPIPEAGGARHAMEAREALHLSAPSPVVQTPPGAQAPPGWSPAPVQADAHSTYLAPSGWQAIGQPPVSDAGQAPAPNNYAVPAGWAIANQNAAEQAALQQALAQKFGK